MISACQSNNEVVIILRGGAWDGKKSWRLFKTKSSLTQPTRHAGVKEGSALVLCGGKKALGNCLIPQALSIPSGVTRMDSAVAMPFWA